MSALKKLVEKALMEALTEDETESAEKFHDAENGKVKIAILQRGWVFVGIYYRQGDDCRLEKSFCIRKWGTTKGIGEIAMGGPTTDTILDESGVVRFHRLTSVALLDCNGEKWASHLGFK